jgi:hypothetical protein
MNRINRKALDQALLVLNNTIDNKQATYDLCICNGGYRVQSIDGGTYYGPRAGTRATYERILAMIVGVELALSKIDEVLEQSVTALGLDFDAATGTEVVQAIRAKKAGAVPWDVEVTETVVYSVSVLATSAEEAEELGESVITDSADRDKYFSVCKDRQAVALL